MDNMKHMKSREEAELDREQRQMKRRKRRKKIPKRYKQRPVDRKNAFNDEELEKYSPQAPASKAAKAESIKKLIVAAVICVLCGAVVFAYANKDKFSFESFGNWFNYELLGKNNGNGYPVDIKGTNINFGNVSLLDGKYLSYVSDTASVALNKNGAEIYDRRIRYSNPIMKTAGAYSIIYNLDGTGYQVCTADEIKIDDNAENNIFFGTINKNGVYAVITKSNSYLSKLSVYDKHGNLKYSYSFSEYYAYCADISDDGNQVIVGALSSENGSALSAVYVLDLNKEEPADFITFDNSTVFSVEYLSNGIALIICDDSFAVYNIKNKTKTKNLYNDRVLTEYCVNKDTGCIAFALSRSGDGRMCDIDYYNSLGEKEITIPTDFKISSVSMYKNRIAVLADNMIYEYNKSGELLNTADAGNDAKVIKLFSLDEAYVVGINEIRSINLTEADLTAAE